MENSQKFERVFLYQPSQNRRTPLPTTENQKWKVSNFNN